MQSDQILLPSLSALDFIQQVTICMFVKTNLLICLSGFSVCLYPLIAAKYEVDIIEHVCFNLKVVDWF